MGNREKLLEGAKRCLYEKGFAHSTARDIAAVCGANLASIGYHFGSKEALLTQAMLEELREWGDELVSVLPGDEGSDPLARMESMWTRLVRSFVDRRALWYATFEAFAEAERSPELHDALGDRVSTCPTVDGYSVHRPKRRRRRRADSPDGRLIPSRAPGRTRRAVVARPWPQPIRK